MAKKTKPKPNTSNIQQTQDGFVNVMTGFNTSRDRNSHFQLEAGIKLNDRELDVFYREYKLAKKCCVKPAEEMTKELIRINDDNSDKFYEILKQLKINSLFKEALITQHLKGGCLVILDVIDGGLLDEPVNVDKISAIGSNYLVVEKKHVTPEGIYNGVSEPEFYLVNLDSGNLRVHESRTLKFRNSDTTLDERKENNSFSDSILQALHEAIRNLALSQNSCSQIIMDLRQTTYNLSGLNEALGEPNSEELIVKKLLMMELSKGIIKAHVLDKEDTVQTNTANVSGIKEFVSIPKDYLTSLVDMPHNILHGESPGSSLGESGQGQMIAWYDYIKSRQTNELAPQYERILTYIAYMLTVDIPKFEFKDLWQMDDKQKAEIENKKADSFKKITDAIKILWETSALSADEIRNLISNSKDFGSLSEKINELLEKAVFKDA